jgi:site-specific recombinase XerD
MGRPFHYNFEALLCLQRVADKTKEAYLRAVADISAFHSKPAEVLTNTEIQEFLHFCIQEKQLAWSSCNVLFCAFIKYYRDYLQRPDSEFSIPPRTRSKKIPMLLSKEEVGRILQAPSNLKHRALLCLIYSSGLRVSEAVSIKPYHIESDRMMLRVEQGKGRKDRYTVLSQKCLVLLREYWRTFQPEKWLFFGRDRKLPMSIGTAQHVYYQAKAKANINKGRGIHTLRHCFASHALDGGTEVFVIKRWMGHSSIRTTYKYIHLNPDYLRRTVSPLDLLYAEGEA